MMRIPEDFIMSPKLLNNYFESMINAFFKILPIREHNDGSLSLYAESLQLEIKGCQRVISATGDDPRIMSLISILQFFIDNPEYPLDKTRREVFNAINVCKRLKEKYGKSDQENSN